MTTTAIANQQFISSAQILEHWQGHRNLTRRVIDAFPEKELFEFSIGGMRPFAKLAVELISIAGPALKGIVEQQIEKFSEEAFKPKTKEEILTKWDSETEVINHYFNQISEERFHKCSIYLVNTNFRCIKIFYTLLIMKCITVVKGILI